MKNIKQFLLSLSILLVPFQGQCMIEEYAQVSCVPELDYFAFYTSAISSENYYTFDCQHDDRECFKAKAHRLWDNYGIIDSTGEDYFVLHCDVKSGITFRIKRVFEPLRCIGLATHDLKLYYDDYLIYDGEIEKDDYNITGCDNGFNLVSISFELDVFTLRFQMNINTYQDYSSHTIEIDTSHNSLINAKLPIRLEDVKEDLFKKLKKVNQIWTVNGT